MFHTHPLPQEGEEIKVRTDEMKMRMKEMKVRWECKWGESYLTGTQRGERKRRGKEQTPTQTHLAQSGRTLKGQGKKNWRPKETEPDQRRRGKMEAPEPTYHGET